MAYYEKLLGTGAMLRHTPGQTAVSCTGAAKARRIAANFAKLPEFLRRLKRALPGLLVSAAIMRSVKLAHRVPPVAAMVTHDGQPDGC